MKFPPRDSLKLVVDSLSEPEMNQLLLIAESLAARIVSGYAYEQGLLTPEFALEFEARLKAHHGAHSKQLDRLGLEDAFRAASKAAGRVVSEPLSATQRFIDEIADNKRLP